MNCWNYVTDISTGTEGPCLNHSLRDGRTCSIFLVPVGRYMTLRTGIRTGTHTGTRTDSSKRYRIILVLESIGTIIGTIGIRTGTIF